MRFSFLSLLLVSGLIAASPAAAIVMIREPVQLPNACFDRAVACDPARLAAPPASQDAETPGPVVGVIVGMMALALAFGRRSGLREVVS